MPAIYPSIASCRLTNIEDELSRLKGWPFLHFDIEDGNFVPNITFGLKMIKAVRNISHADFDAHLMVTTPMAYIPSLIELGVKSVAVHLEALPYPLMALHTLRDAGLKAGLALNPGTSIENIIPYLHQIDYVILMATEPDGRGELFQPTTLDKVRYLRRTSKNLSIWVDGDVNHSNIKAITEAGADSVVIGRSVFAADDARAAIECFQSVGGTSDVGTVHNPHRYLTVSAQR